MTYTLAKNIAYFFYKKNIIPKNKLEEYMYGFEILIADISVLLIIGAISLVVQKLIESILFLVAFITLRRQTGGYHASNHLNCNIIFISTYLIYLALIFYLPQNLKFPVMIGELIISMLTVLVLAPISHPNQPISKSKYMRCKRNGIIILIIQCAAAAALTVIRPDLAISVATGMFSVSIYLAAQRIKNHVLS